MFIYCLSYHHQLGLSTKRRAKKPKRRRRQRRRTSTQPFAARPLLSGRHEARSARTGPHRTGPRAAGTAGTRRRTCWCARAATWRGTAARRTSVQPGLWAQLVFFWLLRLNWQLRSVFLTGRGTNMSVRRWQPFLRRLLLT